MDNTKCKVCDKLGHTGRECKATFRKKWPGRPALKMLLRSADGNTVETEFDLDDVLYEQAHEFQVDIMRRALAMRGTPR